MKNVLHVVDAFTNHPFAGNPAAVCLLDGPADETWMKQLASEMNLSETAYLHPIEGGYSLRWLTPTTEVKLCGHATLASAFVLWETRVLQHDQPARFSTLSGWLTCRRRDRWIEMDFPAVVCEPVATPDGLEDALGCSVIACGWNGMDYLVEVDGESTLRSIAPNFTALAKLPIRGVIVTCVGQTGEYDFLSRFFAPRAGVNEDPVTGSAHCALGPYWQTKLGRSELTGYQASNRGGVVKLSVLGDRILLCGQAVMMSRVELLCSVRS